MRETTLRKLAETRYAVTLEPDEVAEIREYLNRRREIPKGCSVCGFYNCHWLSGCRLLATDPLNEPEKRL